jgi:large subunit ribosomal protein L3
MTVGLVGHKSGMTRVFSPDGESIPVSVIEFDSNRVSQLKTREKDGYDAIQVTTGSVKKNKLNKSQIGHFTKANVEAGNSCSEFRVDDTASYKLGSELVVEMFEEGQFVDVTGISKGKGFAGVIKRHNFKMQDATHGNSLAHRAPGSIGQNQTPGRVFKGKKMAGHMGNKQNTVQNLQVVRVDKDRNLLLIRGAIPGAPGGTIIVKPAVKKTSGGE